MITIAAMKLRHLNGFPLDHNREALTCFIFDKVLPKEQPHTLAEMLADIEENWAYDYEDGLTQQGEYIELFIF